MNGTQSVFTGIRFCPIQEFGIGKLCNSPVRTLACIHHTPFYAPGMCNDNLLGPNHGLCGAPRTYLVIRVRGEKGIKYSTVTCLVKKVSELRLNHSLESVSVCTTLSFFPNVQKCSGGHVMHRGKRHGRNREQDTEVLHILTKCQTLADGNHSEAG
jgi:hypothetical protein